MRLSLIVVLVALCAWLFSERHTLQGQLANLESKLETSRKQTAQLDMRLKAIQNDLARSAGEKQSWLQQHIDKGAARLGR